MEVGLAAAQLGVAVADWVISPLAERVVNRALSYLDSCSSDDLKNLEIDTKLVKEILRAADSRSHGHMLEPWMKELKSSYSEAEDILDVIDYHRIESCILSEKHDKSTSTASPCPLKERKTASPSDIGEDINIPQESKIKLKEALDKIRNLISEGQRLLSVLKLHVGCGNINNTESSILATPITTTSAPPTFVFGRDGERDKIIGDLRGSPAAGKCYTVVGIHGIAGSGKTTLAQHVLEKERRSKGDDSFDVIMWIHVTQTFSEVNVLNEMLGIASGTKQVQPEKSNLDKLQTELTEKLKGKKFFLVLDDVWYENVSTQQKLQLILHPFKDGKIGSRILMTSRTTDVAGTLGAKSNLISDIEEEEYISMFMHYALHGATLTGEESRTYCSIGRKIAKKLGRSPLAATTVASQLKKRLNTKYWIYVMKSDLWKDTKGALFWSYQQLEENVKQCFRFCSIFPRRYKLERDELVRLWMAEGFVNTSGKDDMEKVVEDYFNVLLSSSFIQPKHKTSRMEYFTIHDLLHDLAEDVARSDCFRVERGMVGQIPPDVRHLFVESCDPSVFEQILNLEALRTIIMPYSRQDARITKKQFERLLSNLPKLRVLHVCLQKLEGLPECIGGLIHLRSLKICPLPFLSIRIIALPRGFTKLYHLQMFDVTPLTVLECSTNEDMANLVNLRYIICRKLSFPNIGRLKWLRTLRVFIVKETKGYEIHQLEHLDNLFGTLSIKGLENVKSKEEALQAKLGNKVCLSYLTLQWNRNSNLDRTSHDTQTDVFEALHPPFLIKSLLINGYRGQRYPSWLLEEEGDLDNLQELAFSECDALPKTLVGCLNLHTLGIQGCGQDSLPENMERLKSLRTLDISDCENIQSLPELPESLGLLKIRRCPKLKESYEKGGSTWEKIIQQNTTIEFS